MAPPVAMVAGSVTSTGVTSTPLAVTIQVALESWEASLNCSVAEMVWNAASLSPGELPLAVGGRDPAVGELIDALFAELDWPALRTGSVWVADGNAFFNRPGPRLVDSLEILAACVHPDACAAFGAPYADAFERL